MLLLNFLVNCLCCGEREDEVIGTSMMRCNELSGQKPSVCVETFSAQSIPVFDEITSVAGLMASHRSRSSPTRPATHQAVAQSGGGRPLATLLCFAHRINMSV